MKFWGENTLDTKRMSYALKKNTQERSKLKEFAEKQTVWTRRGPFFCFMPGRIFRNEKGKFAVKIYWTQKE